MPIHKPFQLLFRPSSPKKLLSILMIVSTGLYITHHQKEQLPWEEIDEVSKQTQVAETTESQIIYVHQASLSILQRMTRYIATGIGAFIFGCILARFVSEHKCNIKTFLAPRGIWKDIKYEYQDLKAILNRAQPVQMNPKQENNNISTIPRKEDNSYNNHINLNKQEIE